MHPQTALAPPPGGAPPRAPGVTIEALVVTCLDLRERAPRTVRILNREILAGIAVMEVLQ